MKVTGWVMTNRVGSRAEFTVTIDDEDLASCATDEERTRLIDDTVYEQMPSHVEWGWKVAP